MTALKDVARYTGLSISTVSRALHNKSYVKDSTREKVLEAVKALRYSPNVMAQSLKIGRSNTIALMIPSIQNMIFPYITRGVEDTARKHGFMVILSNTDERTGLEKEYIARLKTRLIDGFIIASMMPDSTHIMKLRRDQFPVVLTLRSCNRKIDAVVIDNKKAAYNAVAHLIERGHKRIAIALGDTAVPLYAERFQGYQDALLDYRLGFDPALVMRERDDVRSFYRLTKTMLESGAAPDAAFATNDARAIVVMRALLDAGYRVPEDVSVIGFDDVDIATLVEPPLTTIAQPLYAIGVSAAERLIYQIRYKEKYGVLEKPEITIADTELIVRKSSR
ncbi:MAG: LacI family transcriptional regulator [Spirochaetaceae bacterium]|jgi:LacI family transcriptional regulator|nr:LacI family transcriptional regulator [Spirochaetaceae bacterium]